MKRVVAVVAAVSCVAAVVVIGQYLNALRGPTAVPELSRASPARLTCPKPDADDFYLAADALDQDGLMRSWVSRHLRAMEEPALSCGPVEGTETYRFVWLRSFHAPISIRITTRWHDVASLVSVELDGPTMSGNGFVPGAIRNRIVRQLSSEDWSRWVALVNRMGFWALDSTGEGQGNDGADWILDGRRDRSYYVVHRWSPKQGWFRERLPLPAAGVRPPSGRRVLTDSTDLALHTRACAVTC